MTNEIKHELNLGFELVLTTGEENFNQTESMDLVSGVSGLIDFANSGRGHSLYCSTLTEFVSRYNGKYNALGHSAVINTTIPINIVRCCLMEAPTRQVYLFNDLDKLSEFDIITLHKLCDYFKVEFKSIFDVSYILNLDNPEQPKITRERTPLTQQITNAAGVITNLLHAPFILRAIRNLTPLQDGKLYTGRFYTVKLTEVGNDEFLIDFKSIRESEKQFTIRFVKGEFLISFLGKQLPMSEELMYEILHGLIHEVKQEVSPHVKNKSAMRR